MAGNVGKLNIVVGTVISPLKSGLSSGANLVSGFASSVKSSLGSMAAGIGAGLSLVGLKSWVGGAMDTIRTTGLMAKKLQISTEEFTKLGFAAKKSGIDSQTLASGLGKMERSIGAAATRGGAAAKVFTDIGLSVEELRSLSPDQAFLKISDAVKSIQDPFQQAATITQIFGRGGLDLSVMLNKGSAEITELGNKAKELGITFTDLDVTKIKEATAGWKELKAIVGGVGQQFAIALAPSLKIVNDTLPSIFGAIRSFFSKVRSEVALFIGTWSLQWQLAKVNALIAWDTIKAAAIASFDAIVAGLPILGNNFLITFTNIPKVAIAAWQSIRAGAITLYENIGGVFQDMGAVVLAFSSATVAALQAAFSLENPLKAFRDTFSKTFEESTSGAFADIGEKAQSAFTDSIASQGGLKEMGSVGSAMGVAFQQGFSSSLDTGLDAEKRKIEGQIADVRKEFDAMQKGPQAITGAVTKAGESVAGIAGATNKFAAATQAGTAEAASQIFAAIAAKSGKDDRVAKNTERTAENTDRIASAIENIEMPDLDIVESF